MCPFNHELIAVFRDLLTTAPNPRVIWDAFGRRLGGVLKTTHSRGEPEVIRAVVQAFRPRRNRERFALDLSDYHRNYIRTKWGLAATSAQLSVWVTEYHQIPFASNHAAPSAREFADIGFLTSYRLGHLVEGMANFTQMKKVRRNGKTKVEMGQFLVYKCDDVVSLGKIKKPGSKTQFTLSTYDMLGEFRFYWLIAEDLGSTDVFRRIAGPPPLFVIGGDGYVPQLWPLLEDTTSNLSLFFSVHGLEYLLGLAGISTPCGSPNTRTVTLGLANQEPQAAHARINTEKFLDDILLMAHGIHYRFVDDLAQCASEVESALSRRVEESMPDRTFPIVTIEVSLSDERRD